MYLNGGPKKIITEHPSSKLLVADEAAETVCDEGGYSLAELKQGGEEAELNDVMEVMKDS